MVSPRLNGRRLSAFLAIPARPLTAAVAGKNSWHKSPRLRQAAAPRSHLPAIAAALCLSKFCTTRWNPYHAPVSDRFDARRIDDNRVRRRRLAAGPAAGIAAAEAAAPAADQALYRGTGEAAGTLQ